MRIHKMIPVVILLLSCVDVLCLCEFKVWSMVYLSHHSAVKHIEAGTKWLTFFRHFQMHFLEWKYMFEFWVQFDWICSLESNWQKYSIGWDNGLAPNRRQAIIWTNNCLGASLGLNEIIQGSPFLKIITCPTPRILKFFDLLLWNKEKKSVQIHLPNW